MSVVPDLEGLMIMPLQNLTGIKVGEQFLSSQASNFEEHGGEDFMSNSPM